jgi:hypothetical protein
MSGIISELELKFQGVNSKIIHLKAEKWREDEVMLRRAVDKILDFERIAEDLNDKRELLFEVLCVRQAHLVKTVTATAQTEETSWQRLADHLRFKDLELEEEDEFEIMIRENKFFRVRYRREFDGFRKLRYLEFYNAFADKNSQDDI